MSKKLLRDESGFTLIELMVVVAIIGVLSAIAVPNFKKYQAKAKQSEAKLQLAALYTVEVGAMADYDVYASCLVDLGYDTPPRGYYVVGFYDSAGTDNVIARNGEVLESCNSNSQVYPSLTEGGDPTILYAGLTIDDYMGANPPSDPASLIAEGFQSYKAEASGNIESTLMDHWTITETKSLKNSLTNP